LRIHLKKNKKIIGEIGHALGIAGKPSVCTLYSRQFEKNYDLS
jgi:hypothetical protein